MESQSQIQALQEQTEIRLSGHQIHLPLTILSEIPAIVRHEIESPLFKDSGKQIEVLNKIVRLLAVTFSDDESRRISGGEWIAFVQEFKLTAVEVVEAYTKALKRELVNESGDVIRLFPNLSLIAAGEVLTAFIEFKKNSANYQNGMKKLKELMNPPKVETLEEKRIRIEKLKEDVALLVRETGECRFAFLLWDELFNSGQLESILPDVKQLQKMRQDGIMKLIAKERLNPVFFNKKELKDFENMIQHKQKLPVHNSVRIDIRNQIVINYFKNK